ncbi:hypothetical protein [Streptomyces cyanogenus]|uniref:hypothetical protein n=1 Tax=Streptomyces cyanogenus TaxID=80860 RepID=UPI001AA11EE8
MIAALLRVAPAWNPLKRVGVGLAVVLASVFFSVSVLPGRPQDVGNVESLSDQVDALRGLLITTRPTADLAADVMCHTRPRPAGRRRERVLPAQRLITDQTG